MVFLISAFQIIGALSERAQQMRPSSNASFTPQIRALMGRQIAVRGGSGAPRPTAAQGRPRAPSVRPIIGALSERAQQMRPSSNASFTPQIRALMGRQIAVRGGSGAPRPTAAQGRPRAPSVRPFYGGISSSPGRSNPKSHNLGRGPAPPPPAGTRARPQRATWRPREPPPEPARARTARWAGDRGAQTSPPGAEQKADSPRVAQQPSLTSDDSRAPAPWAAGRLSCWTPRRGAALSGIPSTSSSGVPSSVALSRSHEPLSNQAAASGHKGLPQGAASEGRSRPHSSCRDRLCARPHAGHTHSDLCSNSQLREGGHAHRFRQPSLGDQNHGALMEQRHLQTWWRPPWGGEALPGLGGDI
ncbi:uncharacterized protein LOC114006398 [Tupaia chinensis]|uniref:uncharacterized protein LOC114006398 n=1 Tax=Tupaia chinensis TaxID=246437 RepID=UPI000FFC1B39|nr:uncharacterized protein LOC114006398 [Tupaia chinensis]